MCGGGAWSGGAGATIERAPRTMAFCLSLRGALAARRLRSGRERNRKTRLAGIDVHKISTRAGVLEEEIADV